MILILFQVLQDRPKETDYNMGRKELLRAEKVEGEEERVEGELICRNRQWK